MEKSALPSTKEDSVGSSTEAPPLEALLNASGHKQELERNFGLLSICSLGMTSGNTWIALGGTVVCDTTIQFESTCADVCRQSRFTMEDRLA